MKVNWNRGTGSILLVTCAAVLLISGCGGTVIDSQKAEDAIAQNVENQTGTQVESIECPSDVDVETGATFECLITAADGSTATAELKILSDDADVAIVGLNKS